MADDPEATVAGEMADVIAAVKRDDASLTSVECGFSKLEDGDVQRLAAALRDNSQVTNLKLEGNEIHDAGCTAICEVLVNNGSVKLLDLSHNHVGLSGAQSLARVLTANFSLTTLQLDGNSIRDEGAATIAAALAENAILETLTMENNSIGEIGASAISDALKVNTTLTKLCLKDNILEDTGASHIAEALKVNGKLLYVDLRNNRIEDEGLCHLAIGIAMSRAPFEVVDLQTNLCGQRGFKAIQSAMKKKSSTDIRITYDEEQAKEWAKNPPRKQKREEVPDVPNSPEEALADALMYSASSNEDEMKQMMGEDEILEDFAEGLPATEPDAKLGARLNRILNVLQTAVTGQNQDTGKDIKPDDLPPVIKRIFQRVDDLLPALRKPPTPNDVTLSWGQLTPRLGSTRMRAVEVLACLMRTGYYCILEKFLQPGHVVEICLVRRPASL
eukprot:tig00000113_g5602.t1